MADKKITQLTNITGANLVDADEFVVVDISADETKAITLGELKEAFDSGSGFVRITGDTMTGDLSFGDNDKAIFGAGSDLEIFHNGSASVIKDAGVGDLYLAGSGSVKITNDAINEDMAVFNHNGSVDLYYDSAKKLATTPTGIDVTGTVTADGLTVDGGGSFTQAGGGLKVLNNGTAGYNANIFFGIPDQTDGWTIGQGVTANDGVFRLYDNGGAGVKMSATSGGDISFYEDTGTTAKFFWDASAESLGIGTTSPDNSLHISYADSTAYSDATLDVGIQIENTDTTTNSFSQLHFRTGNSDSYIRNIREGDNLASLAFLTDDGGVTGDVGEAMRISSSGIIYVNGDGTGGRISGDGSGGLNLQDGNGRQTFKIMSPASGSTQALTLDASGNLLVGGTSAYGNSTFTVGFDGDIKASSSSRSAIFNSTTSGYNGTLVEFRVADATVGTIGVEGGDLTIGDAGAGLQFRGIDPCIRPHNMTTNSPSDNTVDLGRSNTRFKDLYLSGKITNDGTGGIQIDTSGNVIAISGSLNLVGTNTQMFASANGQDIQFKFAGVKKAQINNSGLISASNGSEVVPGFRFIDDPNTGMFRATTDTLAFSTAGSEAMRISSGNLLVGKTAAGIANNGIELRANNDVLVTNDGNVALYLNRKSSDGDIVEFRKDGTTVGSIGSYNGAIYIASPDGTDAGLRIGNGYVAPVTTSGAFRDNAIDIGHSSGRFDDIYATNGTINTSDRNEKQDIEALSDAEQRVAVACKGLLRKFRWIDSVAEKGDDARIHFGIIAQDLQDAFAAEGLDAGRYAMFISSTWWEATETYPDDDGVEQTRVNTYETLEEAPEGATERTRLGVRYPELLAFIIAAI